MTLFELEGRWQTRKRSDPIVNALADRHYSRRRPGAGRVAGPGPAIVLLTTDERAVWVSTAPEFNQDGLDVWRCSIFRNEGAGLSSELILEAMAVTSDLWADRPRPADGWRTWVDRRRVASSNPGDCFLKAGWTRDRDYRPGYRQRHLIRLKAPLELGTTALEVSS